MLLPAGPRASDCKNVECNVDAIFLIINDEMCFAHLNLFPSDLHKYLVYIRGLGQLVGERRDCRRGGGDGGGGGGGGGWAGGGGDQVPAAHALLAQGTVRLSAPRVNRSVARLSVQN